MPSNRFSSSHSQRYGVEKRSGARSGTNAGEGVARTSGSATGKGKGRGSNVKETSGTKTTAAFPSLIVSDDDLSVWQSESSSDSSSEDDTLRTSTGIDAASGSSSCTPMFSHKTGPPPLVSSSDDDDDQERRTRLPLPRPNKAISTSKRSTKAKAVAPADVATSPSPTSSPSASPFPAAASSTTTSANSSRVAAVGAPSSSPLASFFNQFPNDVSDDNSVSTQAVQLLGWLDSFMQPYLKQSLYAAEYSLGSSFRITGIVIPQTSPLGKDGTQATDSLGRSIRPFSGEPGHAILTPQWDTSPWHGPAAYPKTHTVFEGRGAPESPADMMFDLVNDLRPLHSSYVAEQILDDLEMPYRVGYFPPCAMNSVDGSTPSFEAALMTRVHRDMRLWEADMHQISPDTRVEISHLTQQLHMDRERAQDTRGAEWDNVGRSVWQTPMVSIDLFAQAFIEEVQDQGFVLPGWFLPSPHVHPFAQLRRLYLNDLSIEKLPSAMFAYMPHLEVLDLTGNELVHIPSSLRVATGLKSLALAGNPLSSVTSMPKLSHFPELRHLDLAGITFREALPSALRRLTKLRTLRCGAHRTFLSQPLTLNMPDLHYLMLPADAKNMLKVIAPQLRHLMGHEPGWSSTQTFPPELPLKLLSLHGSWDFVRSVLPSVGSTQMLSVSMKMPCPTFVPLDTKPATVRGLSAVRTLLAGHEYVFHAVLPHAPLLRHVVMARVQGTLTVKAPTVPSPFVAPMDMVEVLDLSLVTIRKLPDFSKLPRLRVLALEYCNLMTLPMSLARLSNLEALHLAHNNLAAWPLALRQLCSTRLRSLHLHGNANLDPIPEDFIFGVGRNLASLSLDHVAVRRWSDRFHDNACVMHSFPWQRASPYYMDGMDEWLMTHAAKSPTEFGSLLLANVMEHVADRLYALEACKCTRCDHLRIGEMFAVSAWFMRALARRTLRSTGSFSPSTGDCWTKTMRLWQAAAPAVVDMSQLYWHAGVSLEPNIVSLDQRSEQSRHPLPTARLLEAALKVCSFRWPILCEARRMALSKPAYHQGMYVGILPPLELAMGSTAPISLIFVPWDVLNRAARQDVGTYNRGSNQQILVRLFVSDSPVDVLDVVSGTQTAPDVDEQIFSISVRIAIEKPTALIGAEEVECDVERAGSVIAPISLEVLFRNVAAAHTSPLRMSVQTLRLPSPQEVKPRVRTLHAAVRAMRMLRYAFVSNNATFIEEGVELLTCALNLLPMQTCDAPYCCRQVRDSHPHNFMQSARDIMLECKRIVKPSDPSQWPERVAPWANLCAERIAGLIDPDGIVDWATMPRVNMYELETLIVSCADANAQELVSANEFRVTLDSLLRGTRELWVQLGGCERTCMTAVYCSQQCRLKSADTHKLVCPSACMVRGEVDEAVAELREALYVATAEMLQIVPAIVMLVPTSEELQANYLEWLRAVGSLCARDPRSRNCFSGSSSSGAARTPGSKGSGNLSPGKGGQANGASFTFPEFSASPRSSGMSSSPPRAPAASAGPAGSPASPTSTASSTTKGGSGSGSVSRSSTSDSASAPPSSQAPSFSLPKATVDAKVAAPPQKRTRSGK